MSSTKNTKQSVQPKLRFPEFREADNWKSITLGGLSEVVRGGSPRPIDGFLTTAADGLNWLKIGDVDKEAKFVTQTAEKVSMEALSKTRVVNSGDLILSNSMSFGRPYILKIETCIHDGWIAITSITKKIERDFLYYLISAPISQNYFMNNAAGSGVQNLNADIIKNLPAYFPSHAEQKKIAECLSSLDEVIAAEGQKLDALRQHKKGLMQELFPAEGETLPKRRFPEFRDAPEWKVQNLIEITKFINDRMPLEQISIESYVSTENILADFSGVMTASKLPSTGSAIRYEPSDILVSNIRPYLKKVWIADRHGGASNDVIVIRNKNTITDKFLASMIKNDAFIDHVMKGAKGVKMPRGDINLMKEYPVRYPLDKKEQHRIADCLSSLDALITAQSQKLDALRQHKKGLMQLLFPAAHEVQE